MTTPGGDQILEMNPLALAEHSHTLISASSELEMVRHTSQQIVAGLPDSFKGNNADALQEVMAYINQGIDEGQAVIRMHGDAVDTAMGNFAGQDAAGAASMNSVV